MPSKRIDWLTGLGAAAIFLVLLGYIVWPAVAVFGQAFLTDPGAGTERVFTWDHVRGALRGPHLRAVGNSVMLSAVSTTLAGVMGGALAAFYSRWEFPGRSFFASIAILPLTLPPLVGVFAFWRLLNETGIVPRLAEKAFGISIALEKGWAGVYLVHGYSFSVYYYLLLSTAIRQMDASTFEAARNLGASRTRLLLQVAIPQLRPAIVGASLLAFMASMASFTAPYIYIFGEDVLTLNIYRASQTNKLGDVAILCAYMSAASLLILAAVLASDQRAKASGKGAAPRPRQVLSPAGKWGLFACGAIVSLLLATPHLHIALESFVAPGTWGFEIFPPKYTFDNYAKIFRDPKFLQPVMVSLKASLAATAGVAGFGLLAAWWIARKRFVGRKVAAILTMLPWALPGTVIAINLLQAFDRPSWLTLGVPLHGTIGILALAYFVRYVPLTYRSATASIETLDENLELAAENLGAGKTKVFWKIVFPLVAPGLASGALLAFVTALGEFVSSILLYVNETMPIAVNIGLLLRDSYEMAAAYSVLLMAMIMATLVFSAKVLRTGGARF